jgi:predicted NBD/HSP70 family sugar kinase
MKNYVGVDIGGTKMYLLGKVDDKYVEKKVKTGFNCTKEQIKTELDSFLKELPFVPDGVGIAVPGLTSGPGRVEISDVVPGLNGVTADYFSENRFNVRFINDVNAAAVFEAANYPDKHTIAVVMVGTGIGLGIISNGELFEGSRGWSCEIGISLLCTENGIQNVDSLSSGAAILQASKCSPEEFGRQLEEDDNKAKIIIEKAGFYFGITLSNIMYLYNPDIIVVGGSASTYKGYLEKAIGIAENFTLKKHFNCCEIVRPKDIKRMVALGAIEFIMQS